MTSALPNHALFSELSETSLGALLPLRSPSCSAPVRTQENHLTKAERTGNPSFDRTRLLTVFGSRGVSERGGSSKKSARNGPPRQAAKIASKRPFAASELVTPPLDRVQAKKINMEAASQSGDAPSAQASQNPLLCMKCATETRGDSARHRRCGGCLSHFHLACLSGSSALLAAEHTALHRCKLCRVSVPLGGDALTPCHPGEPS